MLTLLAFEALLQHNNGDPCRSMASFLTQHTDGWLLPETARLADRDLSHDDRAGHPQPIASSLGCRFNDWQLAQTADEAMRERHLHARNLLGELDYARLLRQLERSQHPSAGEPLRQVAEERTEYEVRQPKDDQPDILE